MVTRPLKKPAKKQVPKRITPTAKKTSAEDLVLKTAEQYALHRDAMTGQKKEMDNLMPVMRKTMSEAELDEVENGKVRVVYVAPQSSTLDQQKLEKLLGPKMWLKVTTRVLDKNKLDAFVKSHEIDPRVVAKCETLHDGTAYAKVTKK